MPTLFSATSESTQSFWSNISLLDFDISSKTFADWKRKRKKNQQKTPSVILEFFCSFFFPVFFSFPFCPPSSCWDSLMEEKLNRFPLALGCFSSLLLCASWPQKTGLSCYIPPPSPYQIHSSSSFSRCAKGTLLSLEHYSKSGKKQSLETVQENDVFVLKSCEGFFVRLYLFCQESNSFELDMFCLEHLGFDDTLRDPLSSSWREPSPNPRCCGIGQQLWKWVAKSGTLLYLSTLSYRHKQWHWKTVS